METFDLFDYDVNEVSFVDEGAVKESFLILKRGKKSMKELIEKLAKVEIPDEEIDGLAEKHNLSDEDKALLKAMIAIPKTSENVLAAFKEKIKEDDGEGDKSGKTEPDAGDDDEGDTAAPIEDEEKKEIEKSLSDAKAEKEKLEKKLEKLEMENNKKEFVEKAKAFTNSGVESGQLAGLLMEASKGLKKESYDKMLEMLKAYEAAIEKSGLFDEKGTDLEGDTSDAKKSIEKMSKARAEEKKITYETAYTEVLKENPELYNKL